MTCPPHRWFIRTLAPTEDRVTYESWSCERCGAEQTRTQWRPARGWTAREQSILKGEGDA